MEVYIIYTEKERYGTKIGTQTVEVISHCMLNKQEIIDVDAHLRLPDGMSTNILVPCMLDRWLYLGENEAKVFYTIDKGIFDKALQDTYEEVERSVDSMLKYVKQFKAQ